jgi:hypothetical protein
MDFKHFPYWCFYVKCENIFKVFFSHMCPMIKRRNVKTDFAYLNVLQELQQAASKVSLKYTRKCFIKVACSQGRPYYSKL